MALLKSMRKRELGFSNCVNYDLSLSQLQMSHQCSFDQIGYEASPILACCLGRGLMAVAHEGGLIFLNDKRNLTTCKSWEAHSNAVFDIKFRFDQEDQILTASGDQSIALWDINETRLPLLSLEGAHKSSIKAISFKDQNVFSSAARDGCIKVWDLRCHEGNPVSSIPDAHLHQKIASKVAKNDSLRSSPLNCVTCVLYRPFSDYLFSSGANDALIKMWDLRKCKNTKGQVNPVQRLPYLGSSFTMMHGYTSLVFNKMCNKLYGSCTDHCIYEYDLKSFELSQIYNGHRVNNYTKIKVLNDNFLLSGSTTREVHIWSIQGTKKLRKNSPLCLLPHDEEVTTVECDNNNFNIYTCTDDDKVQKWTLFNDKKFCAEEHKSVLCEQNCVEVKVLQEIQCKTPTASPSLSCSPTLLQWLETTTSVEAFRTSKTEKLPRKRCKENKGKHKVAKRQLFLSAKKEKKISDYFLK